MKASASAGRLAIGREAGLVERLAARDVSALADVYDVHAAVVYRLLLAILGHQQDAEDVLQDVFLALLNARSRHIRNLRAYVLAAARNRAISLLRRRHAARRRFPVKLWSGAPMHRGPTPPPQTARCHTGSA